MQPAQTVQGPAVHRQPWQARDSGVVIQRHCHPDKSHQQQHHDGQVKTDGTDSELRYQPTKQLHRRVGDRQDDLENDHGGTPRAPVPAERSDELDDDPSDQQQPEDEKRKTNEGHKRRQREPDLSDEEDVTLLTAPAAASTATPSLPTRTADTHPSSNVAR